MADANPTDEKIFIHRRNETRRQAALEILELIYHVTVNNVRRADRNAVWGILKSIVQAGVMVGALMSMFFIMGMKAAPIRGSYPLFMLTGVFLFMTNMAAIGAAAAAGLQNPLMRHAPINSAVLMIASALSILYRQIIAGLGLLALLHQFIEPVHIEQPFHFTAMFVMSWFSGVCIGILFVSVWPWMPVFMGFFSNAFRRFNMIFSGKLFVVNTMPGYLLVWFTWNPLFHIIDQARGYVFINYSPRFTSIEYAFYVSLALAMIGLMIDFVTRQYVSVSWSAGK